MATSFSPGQTLGRGDLDIFLQNADGNAVNAYTISYAIYYVDPDTDMEVLIGSATRAPVNPVLGEYYASLQVPSTAVPGNYRIRWSLQEFAGGPVQHVVQEWSVEGTSLVVAQQFTASQQQMIDKLRMLLRDQCFVGSEHVKLYFPDGTSEVVTLKFLFDSLDGCPRPKS